MTPSIPLKREYAPTLGELLAPRWHAATRAARVAVIVAIVAVLGLAAALVLTLIDSSYSHGAPVPFHFRYRSLSRRAPQDGEYVRLQADGAGGALENRFAVGPLQLPPYSGRAGGYLPVFATGVIAGLARQYPDFALIGEGEERLNVTSGANNPSGYEIEFTTRQGSEPIDGRVVLLLQPGGDGRRGLTVTMLEHANSSVDKAHPVGSEGVLNLPFGTLTFTG